MPSKSSCQVLIAGAGVTGLSCAYHLKKQGIKNIAIADTGAPGAAAEASAGLASGGQLDNFTRVSHAHGADFAAQLWRLGDAGFSSLGEFCRQKNVPFCHGDRLRLIVSDSEVAEAEKAVAELRQIHPAVKLVTPSSDRRWQNVFSPRVLTIQDEGKTGALIDTDQLLQALKTNSSYQAMPKLQHVETSATGVVATTATGDILQAEIIVFTCHLEMRTYIPALEEALISVADQFGVVTFSSPIAPTLKPGTFWTANHTYEWGGVRADQRSMVVGGGRYLRPMAGIEAQQATYEDKIASHLETQLRKTFLDKQQMNTTAGLAALDCRPCDELPIIGPMFGDQRVLLATGYMGSELSMGFIAGACLAELIAHGKSLALPRRLWPERLRTMETKS